MKYGFLLLLAFYSNFCFSIEVVTDLKPIRMLVRDVVNGSGTTARLVRSSESDIHDHSIGWRPSEVEKVQRGNLLISASLCKYKGLVVKNSLDLSPYIKFVKARSSLDEDVHFWLDPLNAVRIVDAIAQKLTQLDAKNAQLYMQNASKLKDSILSEVDKIKEDIQQNPIRSLSYLVLHDAYQYFELFFNIAKPIGYFYDSKHNPAGLESVQSYMQKIKDGQISCILISSTGNKAIERMGSKVKIVYSSPIGENIKIKYGGYTALLHSTYSAYKECLTI